ncbi:hypothetical protein JTB14_029609 [Gonioctena quinquepunctata]|nr:hypothetical protein JTB14_029609 [Gonioctena quinquepunctata]
MSPDFRSLLLVIITLSCSRSLVSDEIPGSEQVASETNLTPGIQSTAANVEGPILEKHEVPNERKGNIDDGVLSERNENIKESQETENKPFDKAKQFKKKVKRKKGHKSAKFGEKLGHKKGHRTKGFHNTFHKDEYHKEHKLYDDPTKTHRNSNHRKS